MNSESPLESPDDRISNLLAWCCASSIFLSAFLLFQIQPLISKMILPWFGGSPGVWTTCMLFFQVLLLAGYAYAHRVERLAISTRKATVHVTLLVLACLSLPITRAETMRPTDSTHPIEKILMLLLLSVGLPYLMVSSTGPLVQSWFARLYPDRSPYRLYALSNFGSLVALLSYPVLVEPTLAVLVQGYIWSAGFVVFAAITACIAVTQSTWASQSKWASQPLQQPSADATAASQIPDLRIRLTYWFCLPALAAVMLLAVTNQLCQNVAVVPMLWIAPLSVYLASFIICFDKEQWYVRRWYAPMVALLVLLISKLLLAKHLAGSVWYFEAEYIRMFSNNQFVHIGIYIFGLFLICMLCHGEAVRTKPDPKYITSFYLWIAAAGAVGGLAVSLVCPMVFASFVELNLGLVASFFLALVIFYRDVRVGWLQRPVLRYGYFLVALVGMITVVGAQASSMQSGQLITRRNFYGVLSVSEDISDNPMYNSYSMYSGARVHGGVTLHGRQYPHPEMRREPTLYYTRSSGVGLTFQHVQLAKERHVGVIGLGVGTVATYGKTGDVFRFYEINPVVEELAHEYFTYLKDSAAENHVLLGDGRALLQSEPPQKFDILVVDAFSGDTIPTHLLTKEAFSLYLEKHLKPDGVLAIHVSNRHMNLMPVVALQARHFQTPCTFVRNSGQGLSSYHSTWMLLTRNQTFLSNPEVAMASQRVPPALIEGKLWTDQRNNLFKLLLRGPKYFKDELKNAPYLRNPEQRN